MDYQALADRIAAAYAGLSDGTTTLRASHAVAPDNPVTPCAITLLTGLRDVARVSNRVTATAVFDVMVLYDPTADTGRRYAALLRMLPHALTALSPGITLGNPSEVSGALIGDAQVSLAEQNQDYAGAPWDMIRVPVLVHVAYTDEATA